MLLKEQGYDEFLAEKIRRGQEDVKAGRVFTAEQSRARTQDIIRKKAQEFEEYRLSQQGQVYA